jgi:hypothetical protein
VLRTFGTDGLARAAAEVGARLLVPESQTEALDFRLDGPRARVGTAHS